MFGNRAFHLPMPGLVSGDLWLVNRDTCQRQISLCEEKEICTVRNPSKYFRHLVSLGGLKVGFFSF